MSDLAKKTLETSGYAVSGFAIHKEYKTSTFKVAF